MWLAFRFMVDINSGVLRCEPHICAGGVRTAFCVSDSEGLFGLSISIASKHF